MESSKYNGRIHYDIQSDVKLQYICSRDMFVK